MTGAWSSVLMIETDGDPALVLCALRDAFQIAVLTHSYQGPHARLTFSTPLREADVP